MLEAVLFDWIDTLVRFTWDEELLVAGHRAALGRDDPEFTRRYREVVLGNTDHRPYTELLGELGIEDPRDFIDREHRAWLPAYDVLSSATALLEAVRGRGLKTGVVGNSWPDPGWVLRDDVERFGFAPLLDVQVWSEEVGARKPEPAIFLRAASALVVDPSAVMFVGDRLDTDVAGAAAVGMTTVQALWFTADDTQGVEPDFMAFTPVDVLNAVRRLAL